jgi:hypothetical protein
MFGQGRAGKGFRYLDVCCRTVRGRGFTRWWPLAGLSVKGSTRWEGAPSLVWPVRLRGRRVNVTRSVYRPGAAAGHLPASVREHLMSLHQVSDDMTRGDAVAGSQPGGLGLWNRLCGVPRAGRPWALVPSAESLRARGVRVVGSEAYENGSAWAAVASLGLLADRGTADLRVAVVSRDV